MDFGTHPPQDERLGIKLCMLHTLGLRFGLLCKSRIAVMYMVSTNYQRSPALNIPLQQPGIHVRPPLILLYMMGYLLIIFTSLQQLLSYIFVRGHYNNSNTLSLQWNLP